MIDGGLINGPGKRLGVILGASAVAVSGAADTNENTLATITIPAGAMGLNGILRVTTIWTITSSVNNKTMRIRLGGIGGTAHMAVVATTSAGFSDQRAIQNRNSASSQVSLPAAVASYGTNGAAVVTGTIDTSAATTIVITGQKASAGETITLEQYLVELILP